MEILNQLYTELENVKKIEEKNKCLKADKKRMSQIIYDMMVKTYETQPYQQRVEIYENNNCRNCRCGDCCNFNLPEDILNPIPSNKDFIPSTKGCIHFEWD